MPHHPRTSTQADGVGRASACRIYMFALELQNENRQAEARPTNPSVTFQARATGNALRTSNIQLIFKRFISRLRPAKTHRAKDDSNTRGFAGAYRPAGLCHGCGQRLESPGLERRRALPLLPP